MSAPTGLLKWGQAGTFDAIDDRAVIAALANRTAGIVRAATMAAASGLNVTLGPWQAIVDCGDGTFAVIGTLAPSTITPAAGGGVSRTDIVWADISPDTATWTVNLRTSAEIAGRLGVQLGTITVPPGANLATQFTFAPAAKSYDPFGAKGLVPASDTGWLACTSIASGWTVGGSIGPQARQLNGVVYMRGNLANSAFNGGFTRVCNLPAAVTPPGAVGIWAVGGNTAFFRACQVDTGGAVYMFTSGTTAAWYGLAQCIWPAG